VKGAVVMSEYRRSHNKAENENIFCRRRLIMKGDEEMLSHEVKIGASLLSITHLDIVLIQDRNQDQLGYGQAHATSQAR
jgi:hypothetical protein